MKTLAAVLVSHDKPLELCDLEIPPLRPGQVLVEIAYSGVCRTQLGECKGWRGPDKFLPHCLGHEASGWVRQLSVGCAKFNTLAMIDKPVVLSWLKGGGVDVTGTKYEWIDRPLCQSGRVNAGPVTTFQRFAVVSENRVTPLAKGVDMKQAALLGCPLPTGIGAVWNTAGARPGQSVAVFGCGGVGLSAILGAKLAGCYPITAVDVDVRKLELAVQCGACGTVGPVALKDKADMDSINSIGFDIAVECSGSLQAMEQAMACVRSRGGICVVLGNARSGEMLSIDPRWLNDGKQLRGSWGGDTDVDRDFPLLMLLMQSGKLDASPLIGETFPLESVNEALASLESGGVGRPILDMRS